MYEHSHRANKVIARGALTESKHHDYFSAPFTHVTHGQGVWVFGSDGKKYLDFNCSNGANLFGHSNPHIVSAIQGQLHKGWNYSMGSLLEIEAAERIREICPFVSRVVFAKSHEQALSLAVDISQSHTWRNDSCLFVDPSDPTSTTSIIDQLISENKEAKRLTVFDETNTALRRPNYTFANDTGRRPDIIIMGGNLAGGFPLWVVGLGLGIGENKDWRADDSFAGECLSLVAMTKTLEMLRNQFKLTDLWREANYFMEHFNSLWPEKIRLDGFPTRLTFKGDQKVIATFWREAAQAGMLFTSDVYFSFPHIDHAHLIKSTCKDIISRIRVGQVALETKIPKGLQ